MPTLSPPPVVIQSVVGLPANPYNGSGTAGIVITSGIPTYFQLIGSNLNRIKNVMWYPQDPKSVLWETRNLILIDNTQGTFMIKVLNNYLNINNRMGYISFILDDSSTVVYPTATFGPVSAGPLWLPSDAGFSTG